MAVDTNSKKLSLISILQPYNTPIPTSTGSLSQGDRQHLIWDYSGILWGIWHPTRAITAQNEVYMMVANVSEDYFFDARKEVFHFLAKNQEE